jgi:processing peptidase subunit beta
MNLSIGVGSRDETAETSGSLHSMMVTRYKSSLVTNETVNYGMMQMSGGDYNMKFDRETLTSTASCLDHDVVDIFSMLSDCALEPRNLLAANVSMEKLPHSHKLLRSQNKHLDMDDIVASNIFGFKGLGNKLLGEQSNISSLNAFTLQKFQIQNISTDKIVVSAFGVKNHHEFAELVDMKLGDLQHFSTTSNSREPSVFREGRVVIPENSNSLNVVVAFEGASWSSPNMVACQLLDTLLGGVQGSQTDALFLPDGELYNAFYLNEAGVDCVEAFSQHFSDTGVFGLCMNAQAQSAPETIGKLLSCVGTLVKGLTEEQFSSAKRRLKMRVFRALDNPPTRVEEMSRNVLTLEKVAFTDFVNSLETLNRKDFIKQAQQILKGKMNVTAKGGNAENTPELSSLKKLLA